MTHFCCFCSLFQQANSCNTTMYNHCTISAFTTGTCHTVQCCPNNIPSFIAVTLCRYSILQWLHHLTSMGRILGWWSKKPKSNHGIVFPEKNIILNTVSFQAFLLDINYNFTDCSTVNSLWTVSTVPIYLGCEMVWEGKQKWCHFIKWHHRVHLQWGAKMWAPLV